VAASPPRPVCSTPFHGPLRASLPKRRSALAPAPPERQDNEPPAAERLIFAAIYCRGADPAAASLFSSAEPTVSKARRIQIPACFRPCATAGVRRNGRLPDRISFDRWHNRAVIPYGRFPSPNQNCKVGVDTSSHPDIRNCREFQWDAPRQSPCKRQKFNDLHFIIAKFLRIHFDGAHFDRAHFDIAHSTEHISTEHGFDVCNYFGRGMNIYTRCDIRPALITRPVANR